MKKKTRFILLVLCAVLVFSLALSAVFVITHAEHECTGGGCEICHQLQRCEQLLKKDLLTAAALAGLVFSCFCCLLVVSRQGISEPTPTLVGMKVKLSC